MKVLEEGMLGESAGRINSMAAATATLKEPSHLDSEKEGYSDGKVRNQSSRLFVEYDILARTII